MNQTDTFLIDSYTLSSLTFTKPKKVKDFLVSKNVIIGEQATKLSTLKADDVDAFWSEQSLDEEFEMDWKKNRHTKGASPLKLPIKVRGK